MAKGHFTESGSNLYKQYLLRKITCFTCARSYPQYHKMLLVTIFYPAIGFMRVNNLNHRNVFKKIRLFSYSHSIIFSVGK